MNDLKIYTGLSRRETSWRPLTISWSDLCTRLSRTKYTAETVAEYQNMTHDKRVEAKDIGGFVGGELQGGIRKKSAVVNRTLLTLDADFAPYDLWDTYTMFYDYACLMHTTHSHTPENPRFRLFFPLPRAVTPDEYEALSRKVAQMIGIDYFDDTTYEPSRLMFWPSTPKGGDFKCWTQDGPWIDPDEILGMYRDWRDVGEWPTSSHQQNAIRKAATQQENPLKKTGLVGAFCRVYKIPDVIDKYLRDAYAPTDDPNRYTYIKGSTTGGLVLYDDGVFAYSHHDTDPASGLLCNAFDLVRVHRYGNTDEVASMDKMRQLCQGDDAVMKMLTTVNRETAYEDFADESNVLAHLDTDYTEQGNAVALADQVRDVLRWQPSLGWCFWDGAVWVKDTEPMAMYLAMQFNDQLIADAQRALQLAANDDEKKAAGKQMQWAKSSRMANRTINTMKFLKSMLVEADPNKFDADPWILNTPGGIVDLKTGATERHDSSYMCTKMTSVTPAAGKAPKWQDFLRLVTCDDQEYIDYLQMLAGTACVGKVYEEGLIIAYGNGSNGKSTFFQVWQRVLGSYAGTVRNEVLLGNRNGTEVVGQAALKGLRLVITSELEEGQSLSASLLKRLTSRDEISARQLYHEPITFFPSHTTVLHTNYLPKLRSCDGGTKRRLTGAPFTATIKKEDAIQDFADVLIREEGPQILQWMIDGAKLFYKAGMKVKKPKVVRAATENYINSEDRVGQFLEERCDDSNPNATVPSSAIFAEFKDWCNENNMYIGRQNEFSKSLEARGFEKRRTSKGFAFRGLKIVDDGVL